MADVKGIRTEADYTAALARVEELMDAEPGTPEGEELDTLADLVERYESRHLALLGQPSASDPVKPACSQEPDPIHGRSCGYRPMTDSGTPGFAPSFRGPVG